MLTDQEYRARKDAMCKKFSSCKQGCPFFAYCEEQGIHACGTLCEIVEFKDWDKAVEIVENWKEV
jgi:hypothetical protein